MDAVLFKMIQMKMPLTLPRSIATNKFANRAFSDFLLVPIQQPKLLCSTLLGVTCHTPLPVPQAWLFGRSARNWQQPARRQD